MFGNKRQRVFSISLLRFRLFFCPPLLFLSLLKYVPYRSECSTLLLFPKSEKSQLEMTFGNPSCSAGAAGERKARSLELLLFGFSFNPRGTRVNEEEENRSRMSSLSATE